MALVLAVLSGAAWLCVDARNSYFTEVAELRRLGARKVEEFWEADSHHAEYFAQQFRTDALRFGDASTGVPFRGDGVGGTVRLPRSEVGRLGKEPWRVAVAYPGGLPPPALADPDVRLAVETGRAPASLQQADPSAVEFAALLDEPDVDRLRRAALPAGTKLFVVRRWLRRQGPDPKWRSAEHFLEAVAALHPVRALAPGVHRFGPAYAFSLADPAPRLLVASTNTLPELSTYSEELGAGGDFRLRYHFPGTDPVGHVLWQGRLEEPLAGTWSVEAVHGDRWWRSHHFAWLRGPGSAIQLSVLVLLGALLLAVRKRRHLDEARVRFITELAHDLRTPLTALRVHADLLASGRAPPGQHGRYAVVMAQESARLSGLLANLLDLSRLDRKTRVFERRPIRARDAANGAVRDFVALYPDREGDVRVEGDDDTRLMGDRAALARCLANLLDNAGKFTAPGTPIEISWQASNGKVAVRVADAGPGIARAERKALFLRYRRGRAAEEGGVPGTGMGLALVRELAEGMGGSVAHVDADGGACFELRLPGAVHG